MTARPDKVVACPECGGADLEWQPTYQTNSGVVDGRLRMHDVRCNFVLGCNSCSETLRVVSADEFAAALQSANARLAAVLALADDWEIRGLEIDSFAESEGDRYTAETLTQAAEAIRRAAAGEGDANQGDGNV